MEQDHLQSVAFGLSRNWFFFQRAITVQKLLRRPERRMVQFLGALDQAESPPKFLVKRLSVVLHHIEAAALLATLGAKGADKNVTASFDGQDDVPNKSEPLRWLCQEVKNGPIMPDVI